MMTRFHGHCGYDASDIDYKTVHSALCEFTSIRSVDCLVTYIFHDPWRDGKGTRKWKVKSSLVSFLCVFPYCGIYFMFDQL